MFITSGICQCLVRSVELHVMVVTDSSVAIAIIRSCDSSLLARRDDTQSAEVHCVFFVEEHQ